MYLYLYVSNNLTTWSGTTVPNLEIWKRRSHRAKRAWLVNSPCLFTSVVKIWSLCDHLSEVMPRWIWSVMGYWSLPDDVTRSGKKITAVQLMPISTLKGTSTRVSQTLADVLLLYHRQLTDCRGVGSLQIPVAVKIMIIIISVSNCN